MRQNNPGLSLGLYCALFGFSRQAYYKAHHQAEKTSIAHIVVLMLVAEFRDAIPMLGARKLLHLSHDFHEGVSTADY